MKEKDKRIVIGGKTLKYLRPMAADHEFFRQGFIFGVKKIRGAPKKEADPKNRN